METESYERDFTSVSSLQEFRQLMSRSYDSTVVPHDRELEGVGGPDRAAQYALAGAFLVSYSQIVIAIWDGEREETLGGTAQIVRFALRGVPAKYSSNFAEPLRTNETGAVYRVSVGRASGGSSSVGSTSASWLYPGGDTADAKGLRRVRAGFEQNLRSLERFNRDVVTANTRHDASNTSEYLRSRGREALERVDADATLDYTRTLFALADALALGCRNWTHAAMIAIFCAIGIAAVLFSLYANLFPDAPILYVAFIGVVAFAFGVDTFVGRERLQDRFQDYRALAEGLRVQYYWRLAGIGESVYDHYLARQAGELDWIRNATRAARLLRYSPPEPASGDDVRASLEIVLVRWINGERAYFAKVAVKEQAMASRIKWAANACLVATGIVAIVLSVAVAEQTSSYRSVMITVLTLALSAAGLFAGYAQKRAHDEHARRYQRMCLFYKMAGDRASLLLDEGDVVRARIVLMQVGREALAETCDWLLLHRERQIDIPTA
ncbi:MAG: hypothetical protein WB615_00640 [Candidatus Tumulicola sp.]